MFGALSCKVLVVRDEVRRASGGVRANHDKAPRDKPLLVLQCVDDPVSHRVGVQRCRPCRVLFEVVMGVHVNRYAGTGLDDAQRSGRLITWSESLCHESGARSGAAGDATHHLGSIRARDVPCGQTCARASIAVLSQRVPVRSRQLSSEEDDPCDLTQNKRVVLDGGGASL